MTPAFHYPRDVGFSCRECGDCCRSWDVPLGPAETERLSALDWSGRVPELVGVAPAAAEAAGGGGRPARLTRRPDGACVYLGARNQCRIHEHFGEAAKPLACRRYPFSFTPAGDRVAVDVSFYCSSVSAGDGAPIATRIPTWATLVGATGRASPRRHRLRPTVPLDEAVLAELERGLLGFLSDDRLTLGEAVRCMLRLARLGTTGDPTLPTASLLRAAIAAGLPDQVRAAPNDAQMDDTQRAVFYQWLHLALNPAPAGPAASDTARERRLTRHARAGRRFRDRRGRPEIDHVALNVDFAAVDAVAATRVLGGPCGPLRTFLAAKVIGRKFLTAGDTELPFVEAVPKFLLCVPMIAWTARATAAGRRVAAVEESDLRHAIRLIDRTLGQLPTTWLPEKQRQVHDWVMLETELVEAAMGELVPG